MCVNALRPDFFDKPCVGNLSKGLESVSEGDEKREKGRKRRFTSNCVSEAFIFDLLKTKNVDFFFFINAIRHDFFRQTLCLQPF